MTLEELIDTLESANMLRIFKGDEEIFVGYALNTPYAREYIRKLRATSGLY